MPVHIASQAHPIAARRLALGIPRAKLSELALMSPWTLALIEQGKRALTPLEQQRLELALSTLEEAQVRIRRDVVHIYHAS